MCAIWILKNEYPPELSVVLDEAAVRRQVGGSAVMRDQLTHLIKLIDAAVVDFRVLPFAAGAHVGMINGFTLLEFDREGSADDEPDIPAVAYVLYSSAEWSAFLTGARNGEFDNLIG